eukprot:scaffold4487_cov273-Chaetoceros_neogracile.AAC.1
MYIIDEDFDVVAVLPLVAEADETSYIFHDSSNKNLRTAILPAIKREKLVLLGSCFFRRQATSSIIETNSPTRTSMRIFATFK